MVEFSNDAIDDLIAIRDWIARDSAARAAEKIISIAQACRRLDDMPMLGSALGDGTRMFTKKPWVIIYELNTTGPYIIRIWDSRRNWKVLDDLA